MPGHSFVDFRGHFSWSIILVFSGPPYFGLVVASFSFGGCSIPLGWPFGATLFYLVSFMVSSRTT